MATEIPALHHKMSKKIAQLTKVIYQLNTKNDDLQTDLLHLGAQHENEIQYILKDACRRLGEFQEDVHLKEEQIKQNKALELQKNMFDAEKTNFLAQFEQYKEETKLTQTNIEKKYETQILFLTRDLENIQNQFQTKILEFSALLKQTQESHSTEIQKLNDSHQVQLLELQNKEKDHLASLQSEKTNHTSKIAELQLDLEKQVRKLEERASAEKQAMNVEFQNKLSTLHSESNNMANMTQLKYSEHVGSLESKNTELTTKLNELSAQASDLAEQLNGYKQTISRLESDISNEKRAHSQTVTTSQQTIQLQTSELQKLTLQLEALNLTASQKESTITMQSNETKQQNNTISQLQLQNRDLLSWKDEKEKEIVQLQDSIRQLNMELSSTKENIVGLENTIKHLNGQKKLAQSTLQQQINSFIDNYSTKIDVWHSRLDGYSDKLRQQYKNSTSTIEYINKLTNEKKNLEQSNNTLTHQLAEANDTIKIVNNNLQCIQSQYNSLFEEFSASNEQSKDATNQSSKFIEDLKAKHDSQLLEYNSAVKGKEQEIDDLKKQCTAHQRNIDMLNNSLLQNEQIQTQSISTINELKEKMVIEWSNKEKQLKNQITMQHGQLLLELQLKVNQHVELLDNSIKQMHSKMNHYNDLIKHQTNNMTKVQLSIYQLKQNNMEHVQQSNEEWMEKMNSVQAEYESKNNNLSAKYEKNLELKQQEYDIALNDKIQELTLLHESEVAELNSSHKEYVVTLTEELETKWMNNVLFNEKDRKRKEDELISHIKQEKDLAIANLLDENKQQQKSYQLLIDSKNSMISHLEERIKEQEEKNLQCAQELQKLQLELKSKDNMYITKRNELLNEMKDNNEKLTQKYESILATIKADSTNQLQQITNEFTQIKQALEEKCASLQQQVAAADYHYKNRSPRPQDIEAIQSLQNEISDNIAFITKLKNDQKQMRLELQNREESFNKIFNKSPQIGVPQIAKTQDMSKSSSTSPKLPPLSARGDRSAKSSSPKSK